MHKNAGLFNDVIEKKYHQDNFLLQELEIKLPSCDSSKLKPREKISDNAARSHQNMVNWTNDNKSMKPQANSRKNYSEIQKTSSDEIQTYSQSDILSIRNKYNGHISQFIENSPDLSLFEQQNTMKTDWYDLAKVDSYHRSENEPPSFIMNTLQTYISMEQADLERLLALRGSSNSFQINKKASLRNQSVQSSENSTTSVDTSSPMLSYKIRL